VFDLSRLVPRNWVGSQVIRYFSAFSALTVGPYVYVLKLGEMITPYHLSNHFLQTLSKSGKQTDYRINSYHARSAPSDVRYIVPHLRSDLR
jgi:hypothetical protein